MSALDFSFKVLNTSKNFRQLDRKYFLFPRIVFVVIWIIRFIKEWQYDVYIPCLNTNVLQFELLVCPLHCVYNKLFALEMAATGHLNDALKASFTIVSSLKDAICT